MEYEEPPRGRVVYSTRTCQFEVLADRCIISEKRWIGIVMENSLKNFWQRKTGAGSVYAI